MAPPSNDGVHPSHHPAYGSRTGRFIVHLFNRSLHQLKLFHTLSNRLHTFQGIGHPLKKIYAPILISERTMFSTSPCVRPVQYFTPRHFEYNDFGWLQKIFKSFQLKNYINFLKKPIHNHSTRFYFKNKSLYL